MRSAKFKPGDTVRRKTQPELVGRVLDEGYEEEATGQWIYRVRFGTSSRSLAATEIELLPDDLDVWEDIRNGIFGDSVAFKTLMTYERLNRPPSPIAASFGSAKAAFYPFQFKPLLKFLENPQKRLLIADDVGLGKTVEAGYIIRELRSQVSVERVLLVVPSRLCTKWKDEMERRFGDPFEIVKGRQIAELRQKMQRDHELECFSWIVSIESARSKEVTEFLNELQPPIDVVVVDEAHRMRNSSTNQNRLGRALSSCAEHMIMLTATPVQTGIDNLYQLLHILDDSEFDNAGLFEKRAIANRPFVLASSAIRLNPPAVKTALEALEQTKHDPYTRPLTQSNYFTNLVERCENALNLNRAELVALQRDINELSYTGKILSRTRKSEVLPNQTVRRPQSVVIEFTDAEQHFYESVIELCQLIRPDLSGWGHSMAALQWFRATASSIPAAAYRFREELANGHGFVDRLDDEFENESGAKRQGTDSTRRRTHEVEAKIHEITDLIELLTDEDTKFENLLDTLERIWESDVESGRPHRKVVLFAFFKATLNYLADRLNRENIETRLITGDVAIPVRESRIDEFASDPAIRVLLSSEVGSEGLDLQFASVVVNYDLPWNPMTIEQRIGRVDRIGQNSDSIVIVNLAAKDTIEDRILLRLYKRIGIFENTIGEIDPILGESVEKIAAEALFENLSQKEQYESAMKTADAMMDEKQKAEDLVRKSDRLLAADQSFIDEIDGLIGRRRIPNAEELHTYVRRYLDVNYAGSRFPDGLKEGVREIRTPRAFAQKIEAALPQDFEARRFAYRLEQGATKATFNQDVATKHANAELIHSRHPLVRTVTEGLKNSPWPRAFALSLRSHKLVDTAIGLLGDFAFEIHLFDTGGVRPHINLVPLVIDTKGSLVGESESEDLLLSLLQHASQVDPSPVLSDVQVQQFSSVLQDQLIKRRQNTQLAEQSLNELRADRLKATLQVTHDHLVNKARRVLENHKANQVAKFAMNMAEARLNRAVQERRNKLSEIDSVASPTLETELIAAGVLQIKK